MATFSLEVLRSFITKFVTLITCQNRRFMLLVTVSARLGLVVAVMRIRLEFGSLLLDGIPADMTCKTNGFFGNFSRPGLAVTSVTLHIHLCMFAMELHLC